MITAYLKANIGVLWALGHEVLQKRKWKWTQFQPRQRTCRQLLCVSKGTSLEWSSSSVPGEGGVTEGTPHSPLESISAGTSERGHLDLRQRMLFLRFTHATCLLKYIRSGLRVKYYRLCLFSPIASDSSLSPLRPHSFPLFPSPLSAGTPLPLGCLSKAGSSACTQSQCRQQQNVGGGTPKVTGVGCGLGAADP